jgi:hypothetical protein
MMICESFDQSAINNMSIALARACRNIPVEVRTHQDRLFVAKRILEFAQGGNTRLGDLTAVGVQAVNELQTANKAA